MACDYMDRECPYLNQCSKCSMFMLSWMTFVELLYSILNYLKLICNFLISFIFFVPFQNMHLMNCSALLCIAPLLSTLHSMWSSNMQLSTLWFNHFEEYYTELHKNYLGIPRTPIITVSVSITIYIVASSK